LVNHHPSELRCLHSYSLLFTKANMVDFKTLWKAPLVNPINLKARSVPYFNPIDKYGRVFFFSWFGFLIAFWSWYAFPPLVSQLLGACIFSTQTDWTLSWK
jgi:hypothetical protein